MERGFIHSSFSVQSANYLLGQPHLRHGQGAVPVEVKLSRERRRLDRAVLGHGADPAGQRLAVEGL
ncbi:hypothetical protein OH805_17655 [Streptomyces sp. NBC_00879]|nr:hypothetical protein OH805_17655 [Streptomyces sp. NBC_00879]